MNRTPPQRRRTVPTQLAAMAVGVSEATVRKWASRGKLTRYGRPGRAEYDLDELLVLSEERAWASLA
ncbi:MAG: MerR family transcriptional regulator [Pseudonocardiaceae bacterium]|nr:MerR family transcriptional regulator [Pseudonocardiaceae bacterium]